MQFCPKRGRGVLANFATSVKCFNAEITPRGESGREGGGRMHISPPPPYLRPLVAVRGQGFLGLRGFNLSEAVHII